jgi:hypothetical protein
MVTHVVNGQSRVLALRAQGGRYSIDSQRLGSGGQIEVGLSDGLNTEIQVIPR